MELGKKFPKVYMACGKNDFLYENPTVRIDNSVIFLELQPKGKWCECLFPDSLRIRMVSTPKNSALEEYGKNYQKNVFPIHFKVQKERSWPSRCLWVIVTIIALWKMDVEKSTDEDKALILQHQKEAVLAEGGTWIEPEERARLEQEEADRQAEEERIQELKKLCQEKGLNFEEENKKYFEKQEKRKNSLIGKLLG